MPSAVQVTFEVALCVSHREVQAACCSILGSMFAQLFSQPDTLQQCSIFVQPVLARISECLDSSRHGNSPTCGDARAALITLLRQLTLDAPPALHAALAESDPLPPGIIIYRSRLSFWCPSCVVC